MPMRIAAGLIRDRSNLNEVHKIGDGGSGSYKSGFALGFAGGLAILRGWLAHFVVIALGLATIMIFNGKMDADYDRALEVYRTL